MITAKAHGKIIISGEHAVVYKNPALAMPINIFATTTITKNLEKRIALNLQNLKYKCDFGFGQLKKHTDIIKNRYAAFLQQRISIKDVLRHPSELIIYTIGSFLSCFEINLNQGLTIDINSKIPGGFGLGSSAAVIISMLKALREFFAVQADDEDILNLGISIESAQHGTSSGLDIYVAFYGCAIYFAERKFSMIKTPEIPMYFVNTGKPESSTGVCVSTVATKLNQSSVLQKFSDVTKALKNAFDDNDIVAVKKYIKENNNLLEEIGIVPKKVAAFISRVEQLDMVAKVSGAGAVFGDKAGIVLVVGCHDISDLVSEFGYEILDINGE